MKPAVITPSTALLALAGSLLGAAPPGTAFTYQGQLADAGQPAHGAYDFRFAIYDGASGGGLVAGPVTNGPVDVSHGLFSVTLDFGRGVFAGEARWLEIAVRTNGAASFTALSPRQPLTPTPHALYAVNAGAANSAFGVAAGVVGNASLAPGAVTTDKIADGTVTAADVNAASFNTTFWRATGNAGTTPGSHFLGTTDNQSVEIKANNSRVLRFEPNEGDAPNLVGGSSVNFVGTGVVGATIGGGGAADFWNYPYTNSVLAHFGTIGGGGGSTIQPWANAGTVGGGIGNSIQTGAALATIGGGSLNSIYPQAIQATIGGGEFNFIFSGATNATIGGGGYNRIGTNAFSASIGGGWANTILTNADTATIAGGWQNTIQNSARQATIGGGWNNLGGAPFATVAGGSFNQATHEWATIAGGRDNAATNTYATVPGGRNNVAGGAESFAAGRRAKAIHDGSFVWADATDADFASTKTNQLLIRAGGGVGIGTNNPQSALHVAGTVTASGFSGNGAGLTAVIPADNSVTTAKIADGTIVSADISPSGIEADRIVGGDLRAARLKVGMDHSLTGDFATIAGGRLNVASDQFDAVGGGINNQARGNRSAVGGGDSNVASGPGAFVGGGGWDGSTVSGNLAASPASTIGGGHGNRIETNADYSTIGGGHANIVYAGATEAAIAGGTWHFVEPGSTEATIGGGYHNIIRSNAWQTTIAGGYGNVIGTEAHRATIGGGAVNKVGVNAAYATVAGGCANEATAPGAFVGGGGWNGVEVGGNIANAAAAMVAGGWSNVARATFATVGGGANNTASAEYAYVGGGDRNTASAAWGTVGGGRENLAGGSLSTVAGGLQNTASGDYSTVSGGKENSANMAYAVVGGGTRNQATEYWATIGGGLENVASGQYAAVPGGWANSAGGQFALAAGRRAKANHTGAFVWADSTDADFASTRSNQFNLRATGGVRVDTGSGPGIALSAADTPLITRGWDPFDATAPSNKQGHGRWGVFMEAHSLVLGMPAMGGKTVRIGKYALDGTYSPLATVDQSGNLAITGTLSQASDRAAKENFTAVDSQELLEKVAALPITRWNFKGDAATQHIGPMAQDFHAAFGLGTDDKHIATADADGVALAAIQGLNRKIEETRAELKRRDAENAALRRELTELKQLVRQLLK